MKINNQFGLMLEIEKRDLYQTMIYCCNLDCKKHIKHGEIYGLISTGTLNVRCIYCKECCSLALKEIKKVLDTKLWAFQ